MIDLYNSGIVKANTIDEIRRQTEILSKTSQQKEILPSDNQLDRTTNYIEQDKSIFYNNNKMLLYAGIGIGAVLLILLAKS